MIIKMIKIKNNKLIIQTQTTKYLQLFNKLSQEAEYLMYEIEEENDDIDIYKLDFVGSDREKFNFNTFKMPLNFLSAIYNGKISLKEAKFKQRDLEKEIEELQFYYIPKNKEEIKEIKRVLMHANELWESRNKTIKAFEDDIFLFEHLKKSDDTEEIKSMEEKINLSLFEEFFELSSPADYAKMLINIKNADENEEYVEEIKNRILNLKGRMEIRSDKEKKR